ncbi:MAG: helix-turn-helix domain-containing protein, partial [Chloroflexi bacterium]|nr:helix-turn-helix domain-containing protein [Chloroflexota bacterium]
MHELDELYRHSKSIRLRTRAQMVLLSAEQRMKVGQIAIIVRESEATVLRWLKRYIAEGVNGLHDAPQPGRPSTLTDAYRQQLLETVRSRPRSLDQPYSLWTLQRLPITWLSRRASGSRTRPSVTPCTAVA